MRSLPARAFRGALTFLVPMLAGLALALGPADLRAQASAAMNADANVAEGVAPKHTAPVQVDGETLFIVRGIASFPAKTRASLIEERILAAAQDPAKRQTGWMTRTHPTVLPSGPLFVASKTSLLRGAS